MTSRNEDQDLLCVGGPADGMVRTMRAYQRTIVVPSMKNLGSRLASWPPSDDATPVEVEYVEYERKSFREGLNETIILVPAGTSASDALRRLIDNYKPREAV